MNKTCCLIFAVIFLVMYAQTEEPKHIIISSVYTSAIFIIDEIRKIKK